MAITFVNTTNLSEQDMDDLVRQFSFPLYLYAKRNMRNNIDAEDIVQDCFVRFWEKRKRLENIQSIKSYLYSMVQNECLNRLKRKNIVEYTDLYSVDFSQEEIDEIDAIELMVKAIDTLPPQYSKIMRYSIKGMKNHEIAEELEITESSVKVMKTRSIKKLRTVLNKETLSILMGIINL